MSCLKAGHILSNGLKITIFCFSSVVNVNQIWNTGKNWSFAILQRQHVCTASYSYRVKILVTGFLFKRFIMANFNPYQFTNLRYSPGYSQYGDGLFAPFGSQILSQDSQPSTSSSSSQPSFDRAFEHSQPIQPSPVPSAASGEQRSPIKGRDGVSTTKKFDCSFGLTILKKWKAKIAAKPGRKFARRWTKDKA